MALQPSLRPLIIAGTPNAPHTLDVFIDYVCPFSAKIAKAIDTIVLPLLGPGGKYDGKVKLIIRNQVQPWHGSSTFTHEAALAVARVSPQAFWPYTLAFFSVQDQFYDIPTSTLTPLQIRAKLAEVAATVLGPNELGEFKELIKNKTTPNGGVTVTDELKYTIKYSRQNGIHVSPTVLWDGLVANEISSGWGAEQWTNFFSEKVVA